MLAQRIEPAVDWVVGRTENQVEVGVWLVMQLGLKRVGVRAVTWVGAGPGAPPQYAPQSVLAASRAARPARAVGCPCILV